MPEQPVSPCKEKPSAEKSYWFQKTFSAGSVLDYQPGAGWRLSCVQHSCFGFSQHRFPAHRDWRGQRRHAHRPDAGYHYQTHRRIG